MASEIRSQSKDLGTPIGIISGFLIIGAGIAIQTVEGISIWENSTGSYQLKMQMLHSLCLVAPCSSYGTYAFNSIKTIPSVIAITVEIVSFDYRVIEKMCDLAAIGRKDGLFALEKHAREIDDPFFSNYLEQATFERMQKYFNQTWILK